MNRHRNLIRLELTEVAARRIMQVLQDFVRREHMNVQIHMLAKPELAEKFEASVMLFEALRDQLERSGSKTPGGLFLPKSTRPDFIKR